MKAILAGLGSFGTYWYETIKQDYPHIDLVVVDRDPRAAGRLVDPRERFYTNLAQALDAEKPDFLLNITPPAEHTAVNHLAFDRRIPVLCEKPIAEEYAEACAVVERAAREGVPLMIAENYRRWPVFRAARRTIASGALGEVAALYGHFFRETFFEKEYLLRMPQPTLVDVTVHHLDLVRYLTAAEGRRILARSFNPCGSRYTGHASVDILIEMDNGVQVAYAGSLAGQAFDIPWNGEWRIQGSTAVLLAGETLRLSRGDQVEIITDFSTIAATGVLDEFLSALSEKRPPESDGLDYIKTQRLVHYARESILRGAWVDIPLV